MQGNIKCNGITMGKNSGGFRKEACYIMQENFLQEQFTVSELMKISANLKLGHSLSEKAKQLLVCKQRFTVKKAKTLLNLSFH